MMNSARSDSIKVLALFFIGFIGSFLLSEPVFASWPLGTLTRKSQKTDQCPDGYSCKKFQVRCPGVTGVASGDLALGSAYGPVRGMVLVFTGGQGKAWWTNETVEAFHFGEQLRSRGLQVIQVKWSNSWLLSLPGDRAGIAHLACRPATVINHAHQTYYRPLGLKKIPGTIGFAVTGNSGGASQVSYAMSHYGLDRILDVVIPTGGPPHAALAKSCLNNPEERSYWFPLQTRQFIDRGFGFFEGNGPCALQDPLYIPRWNTESVSPGGNDYHHPETRVCLIVGRNDPKINRIARDYFLQLKRAMSPFVTFRVVPNTGHRIMNTQQGRTALMNAILGKQLE